MTESRLAYIIRKSKEALNKVYIDHPGQLDLFSIVGGYEIIAKEAELNNSIAKILIRGQQAIISVASNCHNEHRKRFSIAHELGHYVLHRDIQSLFEDSEESIVHCYNNSGIEKEADQFAAEYLMPQDIFKKHVLESVQQSPNFFLVRELSDKFNVSLSAAAIRLLSMNVYSAAIVVAVENKVKWVSRDCDFPFWVDRNQHLNPKIAAQKYFIMRSLEKEMIEKEFSNSIFHAFSNSRLRNVLPNLPTLYLYSRNGWSDTPWFITKDK